MNTAAARGFRMSASNVGFAIPVDTAMRIAHQIESGHESGNVHIGPRGMLGVEVADAGYGRRFDSYGDGASVAGVQSGSAAQKAGIAAGDLITSLNGTTVGSASDLTDAMDSSHPGDKVTVGWTDSSGNSHTATVALGSGAAG